MKCSRPCLHERRSLSPTDNSPEETRALYRAFRAGAGVGFDIPGKRALDAAFLRFLDGEAERDTELDGEA